MAGIIVSQTFKSQFVNGDDFTTGSDNSGRLTGSIGDKIQATTTVGFSLVTTSDTVNNFIAFNNSLICTAGDFVAEGWKVGDEIELYDDDATASVFSSRDITNVTSGVITFNGASLGAGVTYTNARLLLTSSLTGLRFRYNIIGNTETVNFVSKIDGTAENSFYADGLVLTTPQSMTPVAGVKSWQTDEDIEVELISVGALADDYTQYYTVTHEFTITPFYLDGELPNIENNIKPNLFVGSNSVKYACDFDLGLTLSAADQTRTVLVEGARGDVGWFEENRNGLAPIYSFSSISYTDTDTGSVVSGIQKTRQTTISAVISSSTANFTTSHRVQCFLFNTASSTAYQQNNNFVFDNFVAERLITTVSDAAIGGTIITEFDCSVLTTSTLQVDLKIEYDAAQQLLVDGLNSVLYITPQASGLKNDTTDRVPVIVSDDEVFQSADEPDLAFINSFEFYPQEFDTTGTAYTDVKGWKEDGYIVEANFDLNTDLEARLRRLDVRLGVYNSTTEQLFYLDSANYVLSGTISNSSGVQLFNIQDTRGFELQSGSDWDLKNLAYDGPNTNSGYNVARYTLTCGMRLRYEDWIPLITAAPEFYDASEPNDGLNMDSSRYDGTSPFEVVTVVDMILQSETGEQSSYLFVSPAFEVEDYDEDGNSPAYWPGVITLEDSSGNEISVIDSDNDTVVKATFSRTSGGNYLTDVWGRIRMYKEGTTFKQPFEIGSYELPKVNTVLKPLSGETELKVTATDPDEVVIEALINKDLIFSNDSWYISARIGGVSSIPDDFDVIFGANYYDDWNFNDTIYAPGDVITTVTSVGVNAGVLTGSGATRPMLVTDVSLGKDVAQFDGSSEYLVVSSSTSDYNFLHNSNGGCIIMIFNPDNTASGTTRRVINNRASGSSIGFGFVLNTSNFQTIAVSNGTTTIMGVATSETFTTDENRSSVSVFDAGNATTSDKGLIYIDNGAVNNGNVGTGATSGSNSTDDLAIAVSPSLATGFYKGTIARIVIADTVPTPTQLTQIQDRLAYEYGTFPI